MLEKITPKKSLGQNFLHSEAIIKDIVRAGNLSKKDTVLEVGPGKGILTAELLKTAGKVISVEKDDRLIPFLEEQFKKEISEGKFTLVHDDILSVDPSDYGLQTTNYKLVANIPYYITGQIFRKFLSGENNPSSIVLLVQKEVAERIITRDSKESILSLSVKAYGEPTYVRTVSAGNFFPKPNVDSAVLAIKHISKKFFNGFSEDLFFKIIKTGFGQKRKMLLGNLKKEFEKEVLEKAFVKCEIDEKARAEDLPIEKWGELAKELAK